MIIHLNSNHINHTYMQAIFIIINFFQAISAYLCSADVYKMYLTYCMSPLYKEDKCFHTLKATSLYKDHLKKKI